MLNFSKKYWCASLKFVFFWCDAMKIFKFLLYILQFPVIYIKETIKTKYKNMFKIGETVKVPVNTQFGQFFVDFLIIDVISEHNRIFIGYYKMNMSKIQYKADNKWYELESVKLNFHK